MGLEMHKTLEEIRGLLDSIAASIDEQVTNEDSFGIGAQNWSFPGLDKNEIIEKINRLSNTIEQYGSEILGTNSDLIVDYVDRLQYIEESLIPNFSGSAFQGIATLFITLDGLRDALSTAFKDDPLVDTTKTIRALQNRVRSKESQILDLGPRVDAIEGMVGRIEDAYNSADQLPTDLQSLSEAREKISKLATDSDNDRARIAVVAKAVDNAMSDIDKQKTAADAVLAKCESAYSAATSVGLAAAFSERSSTLANSMWIWVAGLIAALGAGGSLGYLRITELAKLLDNTSASSSAILVNVVSSILSVGAPVWFAWLATKQVGQRFRLSEDYAFKASVSRAYEGFRREAARFDKEMEGRLLSSALTRLDELPLRLVESGSHGSPLHELMSSDAVKRTLNVVPDFADQVRKLAGRSLERLSKKPANRDGGVQSPSDQTLETDTGE